METIVNVPHALSQPNRFIVNYIQFSSNSTQSDKVPISLSVPQSFAAIESNLKSV